MNALAVPERWGTAWRHPLTLAGMVLTAALAIATSGATLAGLTTAYFLAVLVALSVIDLERRILPNAIVVPSALIVLAARIASDPARAPEWIIAAAGASGVLLVLALINPRGMGMGDVKLAFFLGAGLGAAVVPAFLIASLSVWPYGLYLVARRRDLGGTAIAFGPFLAFGALAAVVLA
jgi:leader peptidase (prepilin peptidase)/N-methyltransferase